MASDTTSSDELRSWVTIAARAASDKQANDVLVLDVGDVLSITDWFVVCDGSNARQVRTIVDEVERQVDEAGGPKPIRIEGLESRQWVLMDYGGFVVHVFLDEARHYYELERLWSDVPRLDWDASDDLSRAAGD
jgi:ribosome-associated protein